MVSQTDNPRARGEGRRGGGEGGKVFCIHAFAYLVLLASRCLTVLTAQEVMHPQCCSLVQGAQPAQDCTSSMKNAWLQQAWRV